MRLNLFLLKRNRNSFHNSSVQCFSLQSLWSSQSCQAPPFCCRGSASHWAQPLLHPESSFLFTPWAKWSPVCRFLSEHLGVHPETCLLSPLCKALCHWKAESGSDLAIKQWMDNWPHSPHFKEQYTSWASVPVERAVCNKHQITEAWNELFVFSLLLFIKCGITYLLLPPLKQFICTQNGFGYRPNFIFTLTKPFYPIAPTLPPPSLVLFVPNEWMLTQASKYKAV